MCDIKECNHCRMVKPTIILDILGRVCVECINKYVEALMDCIPEPVYEEPVDDVEF